MLSKTLLKRFNVIVIAILMLATASQLVYAQQPHNIPPQPKVVWPLQTVFTPSALGLDKNRFAFSLAGTECQWDGCGVDARIFFTVGLGDATKWLGVTITSSIDSINPKDGGFADRGGFYFKLFHVFQQQKFGLAVGINDALNWQPRNQASDSANYYIAGTKYFFIRPNNKYNHVPMTITLGIGNGYLSGDDEAWTQGYLDRWKEIDKVNSYSGFIGMGIQFIPRMGITTDFYANSIWNVLLNFIPLKKLPLRVNLGLTDILNRNPRQDRVAIIGSISFGLSLY